MLGSSFFIDDWREMIKFKNVSKNYGEKQVLNNINLEIDKGDIYGVIGYSGAGKSTLVRLINGLEDITSGTVEVLNQDLNNLNKKDQAKLRQKIGFIFQNFNLLSQKTVYENIYVILQIAGYVKREIDDRIIEVLDIVGLADKHDAYPSELSGGQKQRVGIARAIANNPDILLCDEATSALDPETTKSILQILKNINIKYKLTIVLITHEMEVIANICNKVAVIDDGEIVESGILIVVL